MNQKEFLKSGQYLISEVKTLAENGYSKYWFTADTMRFFNCHKKTITHKKDRVCWKDYC